MKYDKKYFLQKFPGLITVETSLYFYNSSALLSVEEQLAEFEKVCEQIVRVSPNHLVRIEFATYKFQNIQISFTNTLPLELMETLKKATAAQFLFKV